jgi:type IV fimbrial biogenesis protein FimT
MMRGHRAGFTLVELLVVITVAAILLVIGVPGFRDFILMQRLKGTNAQLVTDLQFARSEASARGQWARVAFNSNASMTCYSIYTTTDEFDGTRCDCRLGPGAACDGARTEVRTVQVPVADGVRVDVVLDADNDELAFAFDHVNGRIATIPVDDDPGALAAFRIQTAIDANRTLQTEVGPAGRVSVCATASTTVGAPACP